MHDFYNILIVKYNKNVNALTDFNVCYYLFYKTITFLSFQDKVHALLLSKNSNRCIMSDCN